jgi:hypothetical protein
VNIRVHSWLAFLSKRFLNIEVENAVDIRKAIFASYLLQALIENRRR